MQNIQALNTRQQTPIDDTINSGSSSPVSFFCSQTREHVLSLGLLLPGVSLPLPHHRHQSARQHLCPVALTRIQLQRPAIRPTTLQSDAQRRRHVLLIDGHGSAAGDHRYSTGQGGHSSVSESVHDQRWAAAEQHQDRHREWWSLSRSEGRVSCDW